MYVYLWLRNNVIINLCWINSNNNNNLLIFFPIIVLRTLSVRFFLCCECIRQYVHCFCSYYLLLKLTTSFVALCCSGRGLNVVPITTITAYLNKLRCREGENDGEGFNKQLKSRALLQLNRAYKLKKTIRQFSFLVYNIVSDVILCCIIYIMTAVCASTI